MSEFVAATKPRLFPRIALTGIGGSGRTHTALAIASGLPAGIAGTAVVDTNRGRARLLADQFAFQWLGLSSFAPDSLVRATIAAGRQGLGTLVVDSVSAFWSGPDGIRDAVDRSPSSNDGWRRVRPHERLMMDALAGWPGAVIVTVRARAEYLVDAGGEAGTTLRRASGKLDAREHLEDDFDVVIDLADAGMVAKVTKSHCPDLVGQALERPGPEVGEIIQAWLDADAPPVPAVNPFEVADWVLALDTWDREGLRQRHAALEAAGMLCAVVEDGREQLLTVEELLNARGVALRDEHKRQEQQQRRQQQRQQAEPAAEPTAE